MDILNDTIEKLKKELKDIEVLKKLFSSDFTIPELQKIYEIILDRNLDRRNFRKKIMKSGIIEATGDKNTNRTGRPAELYYFVDQKDELF